jgi:hypothetical protein
MPKVVDLRKPVVFGSLAFHTERNQMARKTVNRKALREEVEAAEAAGTAPAKGAKRKTTRRKKKASDASERRVKAFWGVFNQSMKRVATFEYHEKKEAEKEAEARSQSGKSPHFVRKVKEVIEE